MIGGRARNCQSPHRCATLSKRSTAHAASTAGTSAVQGYLLNITGQIVKRLAPTEARLVPQEPSKIFTKTSHGRPSMKERQQACPRFNNQQYQSHPLPEKIPNLCPRQTAPHTALCGVHSPSAPRPRRATRPFFVTTSRSAHVLHARSTTCAKQARASLQAKVVALVHTACLACCALLSHLFSSCFAKASALFGLSSRQCVRAGLPRATTTCAEEGSGQ